MNPNSILNGCLAQQLVKWLVVASLQSQTDNPHAIVIISHRQWTIAKEKNRIVIGLRKNEHNQSVSLKREAKKSLEARITQALLSLVRDYSQDKLREAKIEQLRKLASIAQAKPKFYEWGKGVARDRFLSTSWREMTLDHANTWLMLISDWIKAQPSA